MQHKAKEFTFIDKSKKEVICKTLPYCFETEDVIRDRIGIENFNKYQQSGKLDFEISLNAVKEDFPKLLENTEDIDWQIQDFDSIQDVYFFFLRYRKNAALNRLTSEKETLLSNLESLQTLLNSLPENLLKKLNFNYTSDK